jgi:hypothetical protein
VRQHVAHKRTFLYLEQLILRAGADGQCTNIKDIHEGLDFFFSHRAHALKLIDFLQVRCVWVWVYGCVGVGVGGVWGVRHVVARSGRDGVCMSWQGMLCGAAWDATPAVDASSLLPALAVAPRSLPRHPGRGAVPLPR